MCAVSFLGDEVGDGVGPVSAFICCRSRNAVGVIVNSFSTTYRLLCDLQLNCDVFGTCTGVLAVVDPALCAGDGNVTGMLIKHIISLGAVCALLKNH